LYALGIALLAAVGWQRIRDRTRGQASQEKDTKDGQLSFVVGVAIVIGMILCLRINAFIALITAAVVVALLAEGDTAANVAGVGGAFGKVCGGIGIVIALAAVIGKCLMDSGVADRIVRSFMSLLGQKLASWALMGSGFVLSVPVFFDTVFYLLVPLARLTGLGATLLLARVLPMTGG